MSATRKTLALVCCWGALSLLVLHTGVQGYSIRPLERVKRGCLAGQQSMTERSDQVAKENMYQKMFHNAFSKFLEAMVRCSEDYAKNKKVSDCFSGQINDKKETQGPAKLVQDEDEASSSQIVNVAKPSSGKNSDSSAKKKISSDYVLYPPSFTEEHQDFPTNQVYSKNEYSGAESKFSSQVAEPIGEYSEEQSVIQQAATVSAVSQSNQPGPQKVESYTTYLPPDNNTDPTQETSTDSFHYKQTNDAVIENTEQPKTEITQPSFDEKSAPEDNTTESNYGSNNDGRNSELESKSTYDEEEKFHVNTENTNEIFPESKYESEGVVDKNADSSQGEESSHTIQGNTEYPDGATEKTVAEKNPRHSSPRTNPGDSKGSDTTIETMQLATSEKNENVGEHKTPVDEKDGPTDVAYEETTTVEYKTYSTVLDSAGSGGDGSELNEVHVENMPNDMLLESASQEQSEKTATVSDDSQDNKTTENTQKSQPEMYTDSSPMGTHIHNEDYETTTEVVYMHESSKTTSQEQVEPTVSSDIHEQQTAVTNVYEEPESTLQQYGNSQTDSGTSVEGKHGDTGPDTSTATEESNSSRYNETQALADESSEQPNAYTSLEYTTSETPKENETVGLDSSTVSVEEEQIHATTKNSSLPPLPYEKSKEYNYSSTEFYPNLKFNEVSDTFSGKPTDRFGRGFAVPPEESNPDNGYLASASLRSEEVYNPDNSGSISAPSDELQSEVVFPDTSTQNIDLDDTMEKPAKLDCKCHITEEFIKQLKQGRWKTLMFEIRPQ